MRPATPSRSTETEAQRLRAQRRASGQPIRYKLPNHIERVTAETTLREAELLVPLPVDDDDYAPLVRGALRASTLMIVAQLATSLLLSNHLGAAVRVTFFLRFFPYLTIQTGPETYRRIWMWSIVSGVIGGCGGALYSLWRHRTERSLMDGWGCGILMAAILLAIQAGQEFFFGPLINTWVLAQAGAGVLASGMIFLGLRPGVEDPATAGSSPGPTGPRRGSLKDSAPRTATSSANTGTAYGRSQNK